MSEISSPEENSPDIVDKSAAPFGDGERSLPRGNAGVNIGDYNTINGPVTNSPTINNFNFGPETAGLFFAQMQALCGSAGTSHHIRKRIDVARDLLAKRQPTDALRHLDEVWDDPDVDSDVDARYRICFNRSSAYLMMDQYTPALEHATEALKLKRDGKTISQVGAILLAMGDREAAEAQLNVALEEFPNEVDSYRLYSDLHPDVNPDDILPVSIRNLRDAKVWRAQYAMMHNDLETAEILGRSLKKDFPDDAYFSYLLARILLIHLVIPGTQQTVPPFSHDKVRILAEAQHEAKRAYEVFGYDEQTGSSCFDFSFVYLHLLALGRENALFASTAGVLFERHPVKEILSLHLIAMHKAGASLYEQMELVDRYEELYDDATLTMARSAILLRCGGEPEVLTDYMETYGLDRTEMPMRFQVDVFGDVSVAQIEAQASQCDRAGELCELALTFKDIGAEEAAKACAYRILSIEPEPWEWSFVAQSLEQLGFIDEAMKFYAMLFETGLGPAEASRYLSLLLKKQRIAELGDGLKRVDESFMSELRFWATELSFLRIIDLSRAYSRGKELLARNRGDLQLRNYVCWFAQVYGDKELNKLLMYDPPADHPVDVNLIRYLASRILVKGRAGDLRRVSEHLIQDPYNEFAAIAVFNLILESGVGKKTRPITSAQQGGIVAVEVDGVPDVYGLGLPADIGAVHTLGMRDRKALALTGLRQGDSVDDCAAFGTIGTIVKVVGVYSIEHYAYHLAVNELRRRGVLQVFKLPDEEELNHETFIGMIEPFLSRTPNYLTKTHSLPVHTYAKFTGKSSYETIAYLCDEKNERIHSGGATVDMIARHDSILRENGKGELLFDSMTLLALFHLGLEHLLDPLEGRVVVSNATMCELLGAHTQKMGGFPGAGVELGVRVCDWVKAHCRVLTEPPRASLPLLAVELLPEEALMTASAAIDAKMVLVSIDPALRASVEECGGTTADLQFLVRHLFISGEVTIHDLINAAYAMVMSGFTMFSVGFNHLDYAMKQFAAGDADLSDGMKLAYLLSCENIDPRSLYDVWSKVFKQLREWRYELIEIVDDGLLWVRAYAFFDRSLFWVYMVYGQIMMVNPMMRRKVDEITPPIGEFGPHNVDYGWYIHADVKLAWESYARKHVWSSYEPLPKMIVVPDAYERFMGFLERHRDKFQQQAKARAERSAH